ncbi:hypothetical protein CLTEP_18560 [Clostridium tepidiprofundi DSM 19306]|uniref:Uncharacterized protein n=1 Tax=Clostridium tepidiprofundi DSM 19306 TaxID=1121338 RepID=A0A151B346_9CLOT|nr:hypothetical protein [Clostridium tepidiprofundi]KYH34203.1 hypothetical protein CLTEP_18560 [Clostridium tepidiprofundi DSM 19306]
MKKRLFSALLTISLLLGVGQVYATTVLDTNIIDLISKSFISIKAHYDDATKNDLNNLDNAYKKKISNYIKYKVNKSFSDIEKYKSSEISRANKELEKYYENLKNAIDSEIDSNTQKTKNSITTEVNNSIESIKNDINNSLSTALKQNLKK